MENQTKKRRSPLSVILTIVGIILCVILVPILVMNITLIVKDLVTKENIPPSVFGVTPLIVDSGSMQPVFEQNDLIFVKHIADTDNLHAGREDGDVAFFKEVVNGKTSFVTHRIVEKETAEDGSIQYITRGDNNNRDDLRPIPAENVLGIYSARIPKLGGFAKFMQTVPGMLLFIGLPIILLFVYDMVRRRLLEKRNPSREAALEAEVNRLRQQQTQQAPEEADTTPKED